ncbi:hypothetical protein [Streptacidiphilus sp. EB129]|uniref:hypothetical protein n=1 Tax=Streptacidiphilus sp. EB129 TaxID=3156262 RepID=UPI0035150C26
MKRMTFAAGASLALASLIISAAPANAHTPNDHSISVCSGTLTSPGVLAGTYKGDVVVKGFCAVNGGAAVVKGDLRIAPGGGLNATFALNDVAGSGTSSLRVKGNLLVGRNAVLAMGCLPQHSPCSDDPNAGTGGTLTGVNRVDGDLIAANALAVIVHASTIHGDVTQAGGGGGLDCSVPTSGIFSLLKSPVFSDYEDNTIGGDLRITRLRTCWLGALRDNVHGDLLDVRNKMADPDADEVHSNVVHGSISCQANSPVVQFGDAANGTPNQVFDNATGECSFTTLKHNPAGDPTATPPIPPGPLTPISVRA